MTHGFDGDCDKPVRECAECMRAWLDRNPHDGHAFECALLADADGRCTCREPSWRGWFFDGELVEPRMRHGPDKVDAKQRCRCAECNTPNNLPTD